MPISNPLCSHSFNFLNVGVSYLAQCENKGLGGLNMERKRRDINYFGLILC
jgi:hypothetical protein